MNSFTARPRRYGSNNIYSQNQFVYKNERKKQFTGIAYIVRDCTFRDHDACKPQGA
jgi:hypothetical protein